jgi:uncharacterized protein YjaG (DUF416 family)
MLSRLRSVFGQRSTATPGYRVVPLADYDATLRVSLRYLPHHVQAAFAAACAERLYPSYAGFLAATRRDDGGIVRQALDLAWEGAMAQAMPGVDSNALVERCVALIPSDGGDDVIPPHADDAIASAAYALQAAAGLDNGEAGWAAQRVTDALDNYLLSTEIDIDAAEAEQRVWHHPLIQAEVTRREDDLRQLGDTSDWTSAVGIVRARAGAVSALPLDLLDHGDSRT